MVMEGTNVELTCECKEQIPKWEGAAWSAHFKNPEKVIDQWGLNSDKIDGFKGEKNFMISFKRPNDCKFPIIFFCLLIARISILDDMDIIETRTQRNLRRVFQLMLEITSSDVSQIILVHS